MKTRNNLMLIALATVAAACGGGSGSGTAGSPGGGLGPAKVPLFATDSPNNDFDHVWIKIFSVDLIRSTGEHVNVFTSTTGMVVDVKSLHDASGGRFQFLDQANVPAGTFSGAQVTLAKTVGMTPHGSDVTSDDQFDDSSNAPVAGQSQITFNFAPALTTASGAPLVLDFDLANWTVSGSGKVHAVVHQGNGQGSQDIDRNERSDFDGVVSGLSGAVGSQTFVLQEEHNGSLTVTTNANTVLFNDDGSASPSLANAERVDVTGALQNNVFVASTIRVERSAAVEAGQRAEGAASNLNATAGTFTLTVTHAEDFVPAQTVLSVTTSATTNFFAGGISLTEADFFTQLASAPAGSEIEVMGAVTGSTMTATTIRLEDQGEHRHGGDGGGNNGSGHQAEVSGPVTNAVASAGTFTVQTKQWYGSAVQSGTGTNVVTTATTEFKIAGQTATLAAWFAALTATSNVVAEGAFANGVLTATEVNIGAITTGHGGGGDGGGGGNGHDG